MSQPLSIYFDAFRTEDYDDGGEEYLTFTGTKTNLGAGMDAKSGVFTAPMAGAYMFTIHVCTHDMKKGLLSLRCNGNEVNSQLFRGGHEKMISMLFRLPASTIKTTIQTTRTAWWDKAS